LTLNALMTPSAVRLAGTSGKRGASSSPRSIQSPDCAGNRSAPLTEPSAGPGDRVRQRLAAGSGQAGDAEQLALAQLEADAAQDPARRSRTSSRASRAPFAASGRTEMSTSLADHHRGEGLGREVGDVARADEPAAAQDGDAIAMSKISFIRARP